MCSPLAPPLRLRLRHATRLLLCHRPALKVRSHLAVRERLTLDSLARLCTSRGPICEIGSYLGASACVLAAGIGDEDSNYPLVCVDTWQNEAMSEGTRDTWTEFLANTAADRQRIRPVRGFSRDVVEEAANAAGHPFALIFFDGDHSLEAVARDWAAYRELLAPGAVVAFHDIGWAEGVQRVVHEEVEPALGRSCRLPNLFWGGLR